jgi:hypothetical protein
MLFLAAPDARFERASSNDSVCGKIGARTEGSVVHVRQSVGCAPAHVHTCTVCMCDGHMDRIKYQDKENETKKIKREKIRNMTEKEKNKKTERQKRNKCTIKRSRKKRKNIDKI